MQQKNNAANLNLIANGLYPDIYRSLFSKYGDNEIFFKEK